MKSASSLLWFFGLTFAVTWPFHILAASIPVGADVPQVVRELLFLPGTIAPALVAVALTAWAEGRGGVRSLLSRILLWRVGARWYVFALSFMAAAKAAAALLHYLVDGTWPPFNAGAVLALLFVVWISMWIQAGEEVGWRGYALPRLSAAMGLGWASVVLGLVWAVWHLPLFLLPGIETTGQSFPVYVLYVVALSVAMTWLYWKTGGSLLLVMLMHAAINNSKGIIPTGSLPSAHPFTLNASLLAWLTVGVLWLCAAYFLVRMAGARDLER